jgi:hypothetical protein
MPFPQFDRSRLDIKPLAQREHDLDLSIMLPLDAQLPVFDHPAIPVLGQRLVDAKRNGAARIVLMGAHVLKAGVSLYLIDMMERGLISHLATTGVFDLLELDEDYRKQAPKTDPRYYYRPWKTILVRTVADGGESFYVRGDHRITVPCAHRAAVVND